MPGTPYFAQFRGAQVDFVAAALIWQTDAAPLLPLSWLGVLRSTPELDFALRLSGGAHGQIAMIITTDVPEHLARAVDRLQSEGRPGRWSIAENAEQFDEIACDGTQGEHIRVHQSGYFSGAHPLACDFRLYRLWAGQGVPDGIRYQLAARWTRPSLEDERSARKYLAWLTLEHPFSESVRALQERLVRRVLEPGWLIDEYMIFSTPTLRTSFLSRLREHFADSAGRLGFSDVPVEIGDFSDWISTGCHSLRDTDIAHALPIRGAATFSDDELTWLARQRATPPRALDGARPTLFISYASADFVDADAVREHLEGGGRKCWIAPRDIDNDALPYTEAIPRAIEHVRAVVLLLSASANDSVHIPRELDLALVRHLPIIPLRLAEVRPAGQLEYLLSTCQWLDAFDRSQGDAMAELDRRLQQLGI